MRHMQLWQSLTKFSSREEEDDDEDGFNDVEEITDDMCEVSHDVSGETSIFSHSNDNSNSFRK